MGGVTQASHAGNMHLAISCQRRLPGTGGEQAPPGGFTSLCNAHQREKHPTKSQDLPLAALLFHEGSQNPKENVLSSVHAYTLTRVCTHTQHSAPGSLIRVI